MAGKRDKSNKECVSHVTSSIKISQNNQCSSCPMRIYNDESATVTFGTGNLYSDYIFVLPNYNTEISLRDNKVLDLLSKTYLDITGNNMFENVYVTRLVKCYNNSEHSLYDVAVRPCISFLNYEIRRLQAKNVVFFGNAYDDYFDNNDIVETHISNKKVYRAFNPAVLLYDNQKYKDDFIKQLTVILNSY